MSGFTVRLRGAAPALTSREYLCLEHGVFDDLVANPPPSVHPCPDCFAPSPLALSAPAVHTQFVVTASRGKSDAKPHRLSMDTRALAEGQSLSEWRAERKKLWADEDRKRRKAAVE